MGIFGNLKRNAKSGNLMSSLNAAGAISHGDYGTAAQIQAMHRQQQQARAKEEAEASQLEQTMAALVARGIPPEQARALVQSGAAGSVLAKFATPSDQGEEWIYFDDGAGNRYRQNKRTGAVDPTPVFIDPNDRQFVVDGQLVKVPNALRPGGQQPPEVLDTLPPHARPIGGGAPSGTGTFQRGWPGFRP
jgi:hypothetical protein